MDSSFGRAESDVYRMGAWASDVMSEASSADELFVEEMMHNDGDDLVDLMSRRQPHQPQKHPIDTPPQDQSYRPPPISTNWEGSLDLDEGENENNGPGVEVVADEQATLNNARVTFNVPLENTAKEFGAAPMPSASMIHFQNPKRYNDNFTSPYPTQSLRPTGSDAGSALDQVVAGNTHGRIQRGPLRKTFRQTTERSSSLAEVTPAFLRRAAQDIGLAKNIHAAASNDVNSNLQEPVPPNSLMNRRDRPAMSTSSNNIMNSSIPDSSFYGADASALDGTFVSIRDLDDDDDVPSIDNDQWNSTTGKEDSEAGFPTETTSLLGGKQMPWQGGFFGSQMEKEDRRERRKMMRARKGWFSGWIWTVQSLLWSREKNVNGSRGAQWEANHPIGSDFVSHGNSHVSGGLARQRLFSLFLIGVLCFHMALCGLHDMFLRYLSYRNPDEEGEAEVSWNGEGQYIPAYWMTFDGRVLNPFVGPGARTLTAFGALVPGLLLSKGQGWRIGTSLLQTSSFLQLILHIWALKTSVGGSMRGLEWKRGTFVVVSLYLISALIGSAWSISVEPGRLITASGMGIAGLLAAASVEGACFPLASKDDEDEAGISAHHNGHGGGSNAVSSSSNEQFSFQPPNVPKKKRRNPLKNGSPTLLLLLEIVTSYWAAYSSLVGTVTAAMAGAACALLLFVGSPPPGSYDGNANRDLLFTEDPPPPPPPPKFAGGDIWRDDDDSADTSIGSGRQVFNTPLMRRSILGDEDEEEAPLGSRASLRKRNVNGSSAKTPGIKSRMISINNKQPFSASRVIARVIGMLLALLLTLIPASLIATGEGPSTEATRASVLGCRPMRILYKQDNDSDRFECAGGCIPLSRERIARKNEGMRVGRCDTIGYRCWQQSGTMTLRNYEVNVGIYVVQSADGSCSDGAGDGDNDGENMPT
mmetsp:Transcript_35837/g.64532  ORF Transcript_35837/g.64532 Transcript_35837/m.64532 type:complete len:926 (+) Transcript_35837:122-2899(+)